MAESNANIPSFEDKNKEKSEAFEKEINEYVYGGFLSLGLAMGSQCGLFDKMIQVNQPMTPQTLAQKTGCKTRYVEEWLRMMTSQGIIEQTDQDGASLYHLPQHKHSALGGGISGVAYMPSMAAAHRKLLSCFSKDGPCGFDFEDVKPTWDIYMPEKPAFFQHVTHNALPQIPRLQDKLRSGIQVLDLGCGDGGFQTLLAPLYPKSHFTAVDIVDECIKEAKETNATNKNTTFQVCDCSKLPDEWTGKFDLVTMEEVLHDLPFPTECLQETWRVLKPGGILSMAEINMDSDMKDQMKMKDKLPSVVNYDFSLYFCLSLSLHTEGSAGLGTCVGKQKIKKMSEEVGFIDVNMQDIADEEGYVHIYGVKKEE